MQEEKFHETILEMLLSRSAPGGGFSDFPGSSYRPDATAWAVLALRLLHTQDEMVGLSLEKLASDQIEDGRVALSEKHPETFWPTALAIFAWYKVGRFDRYQEKALHFMLNHKGECFDRPDFLGHDSSIPGWPWIDGTHSWVEPTAMALMALEITGYGEHTRAILGQKLLMDRQLSDGGWNYGNTSVFDHQLRPMAGPTGLALCALANRVPPEKVGKSLAYLEEQVENLRTPFSLGWCLHGLGAWNKRPDAGSSWILESLDRQHVFGSYSTVQLCLLLAASFGERGFLSLLKEELR